MLYTSNKDIKSNMQSAIMLKVVVVEEVLSACFTTKKVMKINPRNNVMPPCRSNISQIL